MGCSGSRAAHHKAAGDEPAGDQKAAEGTASAAINERVSTDEMAAVRARMTEDSVGGRKTDTGRRNVTLLDKDSHSKRAELLCEEFQREQERKERSLAPSKAKDGAHKKEIRRITSDYVNGSEANAINDIIKRKQAAKALSRNSAPTSERASTDGTEQQEKRKERPASASPSPTTRPSRKLSVYIRLPGTKGGSSESSAGGRASRLSRFSSAGQQSRLSRFSGVGRSIRSSPSHGPSSGRMSTTVQV